MDPFGRITCSMWLDAKNRSDAYVSNTIRYQFLCSQFKLLANHKDYITKRQLFDLLANDKDLEPFVISKLNECIGKPLLLLSVYTIHFIFGSKLPPKTCVYQK